MEDFKKTPAVPNTPPPFFSELGTRAKDLLQKGYLNGLIKLNCKTTNKTGMVFNSMGSLDQQTEKSNGSLDVQYGLSDHGLIFTERWQSENILGVEVKSLRDRLMNGLELVAAVTVASKNGKKNVSIRPSYFTDKFSFDFGLDVDQDGTPVLSGAVVLDYRGLMVGYHSAIDIKNCHLTKSDSCVSLPTRDFDLCAYVHGGEGFGASLFREIKPGFAAALSLEWLAEKPSGKLEIGVEYQLDDETIIRAKVNNTTQIGLGYQQYVREGVMLTMSAIIDCKDFENGQHMFGLAIEFEPQIAL